MIPSHLCTISDFAALSVQLNSTIVLQSLKRPQGVCFVSAKSFYFGVGGGVAEFLKMVNEDAEMCGKSEVTIEDGLSNRREILVLKWRDGVETS